MSRDDRNRLIDLRQGLDLRDRLGPAQTQRQLSRVYDGGSIPTTVPKVFLTHPALADATDTEGASYSTDDDTAITTPVVVLGPSVPVAGDLIVAHAIGGRWLAEHGVTPVITIVGCHTCIPCPIPKKDLACAYTNSLAGDGSVTLAFISTNLWSGTFDIVAGSPASTFTYEITLSCAGVGYQFCLRLTAVNGTPPLTTTQCCVSSGGLKLHDATCSPFHLHFVFGAPGTISLACVNFQSDGFGNFTVDDPDEPPTGCPCTNAVFVPGCNGLGLSGASLTITDYTAATVDSGITDGSGIYAAAVSGLPFSIEVSADRFNTTTFTNETIGCASGATLGMSGHIATGYRCFHGCAAPVAEDLTITFALAGAQTLSYSGGQWSGSFSAAGQSYAVFINSSGVILIQRNGSNCSGVTMTVTSCPPSFAAEITIGGTCAGEIGATADLSE